MAWAEGRDGRKLTAGSALVGLGGQVLAHPQNPSVAHPGNPPAALTGDNFL
jgi:hypothetical protein